MALHKVRIIDSHTGGEPTRVVIDGGPDLGGGSVAHRRERLRGPFDAFRCGVVNEPRGSDVLVGALLCAPQDPACATGVIYFNNVGVIGMCGHGTIGLAVTLAHLGRIPPGLHRIETAVGTVTAQLHDRNRVTVSNVASYRSQASVSVSVAEHSEVVGDVAWGGNWFFLVDAGSMVVAPQNTDALTNFARRIRQALDAQGVRGDDGAEIDHVELFGLPSSTELDSRSFVLCPGNAYDRSPCGTGTSAKLACLHADGKLRPGEIWRQESVIGTVFEAAFDVDASHPGRVLPRITGTAYVTAESTLVFDDDDPLRWGIDHRA